MTTKCPCCGSLVTKDRLIVDLQRNVVTYKDHRKKVSPKLAEFIHVVSEAWPGMASKDAVVSGLWGTVNEPPKSVDSNMRLLAFSARKLTKDWGITFFGTRRGYSMEIKES